MGFPSRELKMQTTHCDAYNKGKKQRDKLRVCLVIKRNPKVNTVELFLYSHIGKTVII